MLSLLKSFGNPSPTRILGPLAVGALVLLGPTARAESVAYGLAEFLFEKSNMVSRTFVQRDPGTSTHFGTVGQIWVGNSYHAYIAAYTSASGNRDFLFNGGSGVTDLQVGKRIIDFNPNDGLDLDNLCNAIATNGTHFFAACRSRNSTGFFDVHMVKFDNNGDLVTAFGTSGLVDTNIGGAGSEHAFVRGMAYDPDTDTVVIVGSVGVVGDYHPFIAKYDAGDGSQVGSTVVIAGIVGTAVGVLYDAENTFYYMASTETLGDRNFYVHRFNTALAESGAPWGDAIDFSLAGAPAGTDSVPASLALFEDVTGEEDYIVVVGGNRANSSTPPWNCAAVAVQTSDGNLASGWGQVPGGNSDIGITLFNHGTLGTGTYDCILNNITAPLSATPFFIAAGTAYNAINYDMLFSKMAISSGDLDTSFDSDGYVTIPLGLGDDVMNGVQFLSNDDSFVIASGRSHGDQFYGGVNVKVNTTTGVLVLPPTIALIEPTWGPDAGGTTVTITGTNFVDGSTSVSFGGSSCEPVIFNTATEIQCDTTAHAAGVVDAVVTVGTEVGTKVDAFEYLPPPTITSVDPNTGGTTGGTQILITGADFKGGATVDIGGAQCLGMVASPTTIQCTTLANTAGPKVVTVTNPDGQSGIQVGGFTYLSSPTITLTNPAIGPVAGGTTLTITGTGFQNPPTIEVAGVTCGSVNYIDPSQVTCITGVASAEGVGDVVLTNPDGIQAVDEDAFTYRANTTVTSISPNVGPLAGGQDVAIEGTGFYTGLTATIGGTTCGAPITLVSSTEYRCRTPAKSAGTYNVVITNTDTSTDSLAGAYTYQGAPFTSTVVPNEGSTTGGTSIVLTGTGYQAGAQVYVGGAACNVTGETPPTSITCTTSANSAGIYSVRVVNTDGQQHVKAAAYTYTAPPQVNSINPSAGRVAGGAPTVTILGSNFMAGSTVTLGGTTCSSPSTTGTTKIVCTPGNHTVPEDDVDVVVTNTDVAAQTGTKVGAYDYQAAPTITSVVASSGTTAGGTNVTITGTNFRAGAIATFDGIACTGAVLTVPTSIVCNTPAHAVGAVSVLVTNTDGQFDSDSFTYTQAAPTITSVFPDAGPAAGGTVVQIKGTSFDSGITARIDGVDCTPTTYIDIDTVLCTTPPGAGSVTVQVENSDFQTADRLNGYAYQTGPAMASVSPTTGPVAGGTTITIRGSNFLNSPPPTVTLKKTSATTANYPCGSVNFINSTHLTCLTSSSSFYEGVVDVEVRNNDLQTATLVDGFAYAPAPVVTSIDPNGGPTDGGTLVEVRGSNFVEGATVDLEGAACTPVIFNNSSRLYCTTTPRVAEEVSVTVTNPDGQSGFLNDGYTYRSPPYISSVTPATGPTSGGTTVTISGSNFATGAFVSFEGSACTIDTLNATTIVCDTTAHAAGVVDITVTNPDNQSSTLVDGFEYGREPNITSISPTQGKSTGNTNVTILGSNFEIGVTVTLGGSACINLNRVSTSQITCTTTSHTPGAVDVVVSNDTGIDDTLINGYVYLAAGSWNAMSNTNRPGAWDKSSAVWTGSKMIVFGGYRSGIISGGKAYDPLTNVWTTIATANAPAPRYFHAAVWTGTRMAIWGGQNLYTRFSDGKFYDPATDTWTGSFSQGAGTPRERSAPSMSFSGNHIVVWGGYAGNVGGSWTNNGAIYDLSNNQWTATNFANAPIARSGKFHSFTPFTTQASNGAITTQANQVMIWGGVTAGSGASNAEGKILDVASNTWFNVNTSGAPSVRARHTAVWDGTKAYVWGGWREETGGPAYRNGNIYTPATNLWAPMAATSVEVRFGHSMVLAGPTILIWGGCTTESYHDTGGEYNIAGDSWQPTVLPGAPEMRAAHHSFWAGNAGVMLVWGGFGWLVPHSSWQNYLDGSRYTPR